MYQGNLLQQLQIAMAKFCRSSLDPISRAEDHLHKKSFRTNNFRKFSVIVNAIDSWNKIQDQMGEIALKDLRPSKIKWLLTNKFIKSY